MTRISTDDKCIIAEMAAHKAMETIQQGFRADRVHCLTFGLRIARPDVLTTDGFDLSQAQYDDLNSRFEQALKVRIKQAHIAR